jgi:hypothetical protein
VLRKAEDVARERAYEIERLTAQVTQLSLQISPGGRPRPRRHKCAGRGFESTACGLNGETDQPHESAPLSAHVEIRTVICSTNAIESLNARYRWACTVHGRFPTEQAALNCLYPVTRFLDPTGQGRTRWTLRWKPALNAFAHRWSGSRHVLKRTAGNTVPGTHPPGQDRGRPQSDGIGAGRSGRASLKVVSRVSAWSRSVSAWWVVSHVWSWWII